MKEPRKEGMAQKEQLAVAAGGELHRGDGAGAEPPAQRRARSGDRCDALGKVLGHRGGRLLGVPGQRHGGVLPLGGADGEQLAAVARGVRGVDAAVEDGLEPVGDVGVVVESEDTVRLRQGLGEVLAVALGHAADGDDGLGAAVLLEIVGFEQGVDGVLLGGFDEPTGVDDCDIRVGGILDEVPAVRCQAACQLLRVHLVTGAAKSDKGDGTAFGHGLKTTLSRRPSRRAGLPALLLLRGVTGALLRGVTGGGPAGNADGRPARGRTPVDGVGRRGISQPRGHPWCT
ncbi:hypothetical protein SMICM304S_02975 [Streptomyces microflavus]